MPSTAYRIDDEPRPGALTRIVVNPLWCLLAIMLGGPWLAWPWFVLNGFGFGSSTRWRELGLAIAGFGGTVVAVFGVILLHDAGVANSQTQLRLLFLGVTVWKLGISYVLYITQGRGFAIYSYYGQGPEQNGMLVAMLGGFLGRRALQDALGASLLSYVLL